MGCQLTLQVCIPHFVVTADAAREIAPDLKIRKGSVKMVNLVRPHVHADKENGQPPDIFLEID
jgi:hypothetical protein